MVSEGKTALRIPVSELDCEFAMRSLAEMNQERNRVHEEIVTCSEERGFAGGRTSRSRRRRSPCEEEAREDGGSSPPCSHALKQVLSVRDQDQLRPLRDMYVRQVSKANIGEQCPPLLCCLAILLEGPSRHRSVSSLESRVA